GREDTQHAGDAGVRGRSRQGGKWGGVSVGGKYVKTFAEASHALPDGMHMNADYPFMLPPIKFMRAGKVVLSGRGTDGEFVIRRESSGQEYCVITQSSSFEKMFGRPPTKFKAYPFKDEDTPAIGAQAKAAKD